MINKEDIKIRYIIEINEPQTHLLNVKMIVPSIFSTPFKIRMPTWLPGCYTIREYVKSVENLNVFSEHFDQIEIEKICKSGWRIKPKPNQQTIINYSVHCYDLSDDSNYIDEIMAILNPGAFLFYIENARTLPCEIVIKKPASWYLITTALSKIKDSPATYFAENFDRLVDSPILIGNHQIFSFKVNGYMFYVAIAGEAQYDLSKFVLDIEKIVKATLDLMKVPPFKEYIFFVVLTNNYGGLEHLDSTLILLDRKGFQSEKSYKKLLSIFSHEFFHSWNVKAIKPCEFEYYDYLRENYTELLWFSEGFTSYYQSRILLKAKLIDIKTYLEALANRIFNYTQIPGRFYQSAAEASFDAWIKYYKQDFNTDNTTISYYLKGSLIATLLDIELRYLTNGKEGLDDLFQILYKELFLNENRGLSYDELIHYINKIAKKDISEFVNNLVFWE